jgi:hypothetical protein
LTFGGMNSVTAGRQPRLNGMKTRHALIAGSLLFLARAPIGAPAAAAAPPPIPKPGPLAQSRSLKQIGTPADQTRAAIPADNPQTPEKVALGEKLFFDGRLSADGTVACATCHDPAQAFTDGRPTSVGIDSRAGERNAPTVLNALYNKAQFWDGRANSLEDQAALPITNPIEMGQPSLEAAVARKRSNASSVELEPRRICSARSPPTSGRSSRSILRSIGSSPEKRAQSLKRRSAAGTDSTVGPAATSAMRPAITSRT